MQLSPFTNILDDFFIAPSIMNSSPLGSLLPSASQSLLDTVPASLTALDVLEDPTHFIVTIDLPGLQKDQVNLGIKENVLIVSGERFTQCSHVEKDKVGLMKMHISERRSGSFERRVRLPKNADVNKIEAGMENGVLCIKFAKKQLSDKEGMKQIKIA